MAINTGIQNEIEIERNLDARKFEALNPNLRAFVNDVFSPTTQEKSTQVVHAKRTNDTRYKPDMIVDYASRKSNISIKIGSGNSVHQEPIDTFVKYIKEELNATQDEVEALLFFHWGDGTLDGSAPVANRMPAKEIIEKYPEKIVTIQNFFNKNEDKLLERFLSTGIFKVSHVDWIYYGSYLTADWRKIEDVYANLKSNPSNALSVGGLNFQTYGRSLNGKDDKRRESIQLKWSNMASFFLVGRKSITDIYSKIKGDNSHGFKNVENIIDSLDGKQFQYIPDTLKEFVFSIFNGACENSDIVHAEKVKGGLKGDMLIWLNQDKQNLKNVAIASGSGNSVHQEKVDSFCEFLKDEVGIDNETIEQYLRFHYADGTSNNTGSVESRQSASEYKKDHEYSLKAIERQLSLKARQIAERFIKKNPDDYPDVDYFFYGDTELPYWASIDTLIDQETTKQPNQRAALAIGDFSIQAWNRSLKGTADHKRLDMQVKWNNLLKNVSNARKKEEQKNLTYVLTTPTVTPTTPEPKRTEPTKKVEIKADESEKNKAIQGIGFEYKFTSALNQDKQSPLWDALGIKENNVYLVNVSYNQVSKIAGSKIRPKSDCYAVKVGKDISQFLEDHNYVLTEEALLENNIPFESILESGISIKLPDSKNYTLQKLSFSTFQNIFTDISPSYFVAALLFTDPTQINKNDLILATFNRTIESLCSDLGINKNNDDLSTYKELKNKAMLTIKRRANEDQAIYDALCFGEEIFENPYTASFIFEDGRLLRRDEYNVTISVTTGSGRSKGSYTLAFK